MLLTHQHLYFCYIFILCSNKDICISLMNFEFQPDQLIGEVTALECLKNHCYKGAEDGSDHVNAQMKDRYFGRDVQQIFSASKIYYI